MPPFAHYSKYLSQSLPTFTNHLEMQVRHKCKNNIIGIVLLFFLKEITVFHKAEHMIPCLLSNNSLCVVMVSRTQIQLFSDVQYSFLSLIKCYSLVLEHIL